MKKRTWLIVTILYTAFIAWGQNDHSQRYIDDFKDIAIKEMNRAGVPASIKLAQGILESNFGRSTLAKRANNHFGMKCGSAWTGKEFYREDDDYDSNGRLIKSCFRVYRNAESSYIAHSEFLADPNKRYRYGFLFRLDPMNYEAWAKGLKSAGYATSATYSQKLIRVIETYELYRFDQEAVGDPIEELPKKRAEQLAGIKKVNGVKFVVADGTETLSQIASKVGEKTRRLKNYNKYNAFANDANKKIPAGTRVFVQEKRNNYTGKQKWHRIQDGQTMLDISNLYGLCYKRLHSKNRLNIGQQPAEGEQLKIRGWFKVNASNKPRTTKQVFNPSRDLEEGEELLFDEGEGEENFGNDIDEELTPLPDTDRPAISNPDTNEPPVVNDPPVVTDPDVDMPDDPEANPMQYYTVVKGDTLFGIARRFGISVSQLKTMNGMTSDSIQAGQWIRVR